MIAILIRCKYPDKEDSLRLFSHEKFRTIYDAERYLYTTYAFDKISSGKAWWIDQPYTATVEYHEIPKGEVPSSHTVWGTPLEERKITCQHL